MLGMFFNRGVSLKGVVIKDTDYGKRTQVLTTVSKF